MACRGGRRRPVAVTGTCQPEPGTGFGFGGERIEADIGDVLVKRGQGGRQREAQALLDVGEQGVALRRYRHRNAKELGDDRHRSAGLFLHHRDAQGDLDLARSAGGADDDASLDADLHHHVALDDGALARDAHEGALVFERHGLAARADGERRSAFADFEPRAADVAGRPGDRLRAFR